jgi:hypothetical protein
VKDGRKVPKRPDILAEDVARRWLAGDSILVLSIAYDCSLGTIDNRLAKARVEFPDLPWGEREVSPTPVGTKEYLEMNDGKQGESVVRQGSVIRSSAMRRR